MNAASTTRVTLLTPSGRAAVAVVLVEGSNALEAVDAVLVRKNGRRLADTPIGRIVVGRWGGASGEKVVVCRRSNDSVEVHCHGGTAAVDAIVARLEDNGCIPGPWQESIPTNYIDPVRTAAHLALADAPTTRTAAILLDQLEGALGGALHRVLTASAEDDWDAAITTLESILVHRQLGLHLARPWRVVIAGRPNVGKSSLLNAILGFERAIVYDMPGTTRDVVTANTAIDGWPVLISDTAGLRPASDTLEAVGIQRANIAAADADLVILVDDSIDGGTVELPVGVPVLRVLNKNDLHRDLTDSTRQRFDACVSAIYDEGISSLLALIGETLVPSPPPAGEAVPFTLEQIAAIEAARDAVQSRDLPAAQRCLQLFLR